MVFLTVETTLEAIRPFRNDVEMRLYETTSEGVNESSVLPGKTGDGMIIKA